MLNTSDAIRFEAVSKRFRLREGQTLKEFLPHFLSRRSSTPPFYALKEVSFSVAHGETVGLVGPNGSGKSTALKLIAGIMQPSEGSVSTNGRIAPLIELGTGFHPELTGRENIFLNGCILGMTNREISEVIEDVVGFAELEQFVDLPIKHYSSGMYLRLAFSVAVHCRPDILILDEALAVGDLGFRDKCYERLNEFKDAGVTILLVSHSMEQVTDFCDRAILLVSGTKVAEGQPEDVIDTYRRMVDLHAKAAASDQSWDAVLAAVDAIR